jgi:N6-L-threonylcarbamoyladenine synthase
MSIKSTNKQICLGIESTAHTFGIALATSDGRIVINNNTTYKSIKGQGIHPREAAQYHSEIAPTILKQVIQQSPRPLSQIDAIAFSAGPGLGPVLRTGATMARALALQLEKPLVSVHHAIGHIEIASLFTGARDPLVQLVSGGHTSIVAFGGGYWRIYGETQDITLGNLLDVFARTAGLPFPGGRAIESLAKKGKHFIDLPYVVKGNDVSYSGLLTAAKLQLKNGVDLEDLCYSLQEVAFAMLTEATERALVHTERSELLITGGVAANKRLQTMLQEVCREHGSTLHIVPLMYSGDCGAQIAWTGVLAYQNGLQVSVEESFVQPKWRFEEIYIPWR